MKTQRDKAPSLRDLYPGLSDEDLKVHEEFFDRLLDVALRIYDGVRADPARYEAFKALTKAKRSPTLKGSRIRSTL
jgi:hypothetical protein